MRLAVCLLTLLPAVAAAQAKPDAAGLFYRAFYYDRGDRDVGRALALYEKFLAAAPNHRLAAEAARCAVNLLKQSRRNRELATFEKKYAALLRSSVKPGINSSFLDPEMSVQRMAARFEVESREIYKYRRKIAELIGLKAGDRIADVGAGTGVLTWPFARLVGKAGRVYAVELAPRFIEHLKKRAKTGGFEQVAVVHCTERSVELPRESVDYVFICDTYHHFEFPKQTMASVHRALRPGGQLILIDFERIPGKSREFILGHVRAGKEVFRSEVESFGFRLVREEKTPLKENYYLRFAKK